MDRQTDKGPENDRGTDMKIGEGGGEKANKKRQPSQKETDIIEKGY